MTLPLDGNVVKCTLIGVPEIANNHTGLQRHRKSHSQRIGYKDYKVNTLNSGRNRDLYLD